MQKILFALVVLALSSADATAGPLRKRAFQPVQPQNVQPTPQPAPNFPSTLPSPSEAVVIIEGDTSLKPIVVEGNAAKSGEVVVIIEGDTSLNSVAVSGEFADIGALHEVNALRASRGLRPFLHDPLLTVAASRAAEFRARHLLFGHVEGGMSDFQFLPPGAVSDTAGCAAYEPSMGWRSCCTYENYTYAGAAWAWGRDGRRYMHIFVR